VFSGINASKQPRLLSALVEVGAPRSSWSSNDGGLAISCRCHAGQRNAQIVQHLIDRGCRVATAPEWPNTFQRPCARSIAAAGLGHSIASPTTTVPSETSKGNATKYVMPVMAHLLNRTNPCDHAARVQTCRAHNPINCGRKRALSGSPPHDSSESGTAARIEWRSKVVS
jgi:hypothetical protein